VNFLELIEVSAASGENLSGILGLVALLKVDTHREACNIRVSGSKILTIVKNVLTDRGLESEYTINLFALNGYE
jgi:hypothetical protein